MRSRYTAYALGVDDHIFRTWHPRTRPADTAPDPSLRWDSLEVLEVSGGEVADLFESADPSGPATFPVAWAGEAESSMWFDIAREYTERWHHQRQIALAVGRPTSIDAHRLYHPVLETILRALPFTFLGVDAPEGTTVGVTIVGEAGGDWFIGRFREGWAMLDEVLSS